jgi:hypothetical protein
MEVPQRKNKNRVQHAGYASTEENKGGQAGIHGENMKNFVIM